MPEAATAVSGDLNCAEALGVRTLAMKSFSGLCGEFVFAVRESGIGEEGRSGSELAGVSLYRGQSFVAAVTGDRNGVLSFAYSRY